MRTSFFSTRAPVSAALLSAVACAALLAASITTSSPAKAWQSGRSEGPFCLESYGRTGMGRICDFYTIAQCQATARGIVGTCAPNPWYVYEEPPPERAVRRRPRY